MVKKYLRHGKSLFEYAYDLFSQKVKNTDPQMKLTDDNVNEHLSRMWQILDNDKVINSIGYTYFCGSASHVIAIRLPDNADKYEELLSLEILYNGKL